MSERSPKDDLLDLLATESYRAGSYDLSSGKSAFYYIDCRRVALDFRRAPLIAKVMLPILEEFGPFDAVGGLGFGALMITTALVSNGYQINGFAIRDEQKLYGTKQSLEGFQGAPGSKVVLIDDVCSTGLSLETAYSKACSYGWNIVGMACLVNRRDLGGRDQLRLYAPYVPFKHVFTGDEIRDKAEEQLSFTK